MINCHVFIQRIILHEISNSSKDLVFTDSQKWLQICKVRWSAPQPETFDKFSEMQIRPWQYLKQRFWILWYDDKMAA